MKKVSYIPRIREVKRFRRNKDGNPECVTVAEYGVWDTRKNKMWFNTHLTYQAFEDCVKAIEMLEVQKGQ